MNSSNFLLRIGIGHDGRCVGKARPFGFDDGVVGLLDALPALVAVHRVVAAAYCRDRNGFRQRRQQSLDVLGSGLRRRIAAVGECVHQRRHAGLGENLCERRGVILMRMHAARRHQSEEMAGAAALFERLDEINQRRRAARSRHWRWPSLIRGRSCITTRPAPMLRWPTSELPICPSGRPDIARRRCAESACGQVCQSRSKVGVLGLANGVVGGLLAPAPAIQNHQHHGPSPLHVGTLGRYEDAGVLRIAARASISD